MASCNIGINNFTGRNCLQLTGVILFCLYWFDHLILVVVITYWISISFSVPDEVVQKARAFTILVTFYILNKSAFINICNFWFQSLCTIIMYYFGFKLMWCSIWIFERLMCVHLFGAASCIILTTFRGLELNITKLNQNMF